MKRVHRLGTVLLLAAVFCISGLAALAASPEGIIEESTAVLKELARQPDAKNVVRLLREAEGVAIFPSVIKAGVGFGGRHGEGILLRRDPKSRRWYGPGYVKITGVSWGLQFGVQSTALVLIIMNDHGLDVLKEGKVTLAGDLAVAVGSEGRQAGAGTDVNLKASIYNYSMSKGFFAGVSIEGSVIETNETANRLYWNAPLSPAEILQREAVDRRVQLLVAALEELTGQGRLL